MSFLVYLLCGLLGGVLGGMGMGGGTLLLPLLTLACGVPQRVAQGVNLAAFVPMSLFALAVHRREGLVETKNLLPAALFSAACALAAAPLAAFLPPAALRAGFGALLLALSLVRARVLVRALFCRKTQKKPPSQQKYF